VTRCCLGFDLGRALDQNAICETSKAAGLKQEMGKNAVSKANKAAALDWKADAIFWMQTVQTHTGISTHARMRTFRHASTPALTCTPAVQVCNHPLL